MNSQNAVRVIIPIEIDRKEYRSEFCYIRNTSISFLKRVYQNEL